MNRLSLKNNYFKNTFIGKKISDNAFVLLAFFCSALLSLLIAFCFNLKPFGDRIILRMDLYHQYGPLFAELADKLKGDGSFLYSWTAGGGSSFLGNFFNYLSSPLSLCMLLFGDKNMPEAVSFMIFTKACLSSATFTYYLKASQKKSNYISAAFGVLYAFSGYFIAYYWNVMWLDALVFMPLIILGIEKIIEKGKPGLYIAVLALNLFANYYIGYMSCILSVVYFLCFYFSKYSITDKLHSYKMPLTKNKFSGEGFFKSLISSRFVSSGLIFTFASVAAAGIVAVCLIPTYFILQECSATSGTFPTEFMTNNNIFDFFANHLASLEPTIRSSGEDVLPNVYCGIITVLLVPAYYYTKSIKLREKIAYTFLLVFLFISFNTNYLNYIWHGFHSPNDLPYRFSFMYSMIILIMGFKAIMRIKEFKAKEILSIGIGVALFIIITEKVGSKNVDTNTVMISLAFVFIYTLVLYMLNSKKFNKQTVCIFLLCAIISEYAISSTGKYEMNQSKTPYYSRYSNIEALKSNIDEKEKNSFYRMELTDLQTKMDPCLFNYRGVSTFTSMAYERLANLQNYLGLAGNVINSYSYNLQTPIYNNMFSIKYILNERKDIIFNPDLYTKVASQGRYTAYKSNYTLPLAYTVSDNINLWNYKIDNPFDVQNDFIFLSTGIRDVLEQEKIDTIDVFNLDPIENEEKMTYFAYQKINTGETADITITSVPKEKRNYYLFVKSEGINSVTVNKGSNELTRTIDDESYIIDLGVCEADIPIVFTLPVDEESEFDGVNFQLYSLDMDKFKQSYDILSKGAIKNLKFEDTLIEGDFTLADDEELYTSIPYDTGWKITIDGREAKPDEIYKTGECLLAVKTKAGDHHIKFTYSPKGLTTGLIISIATDILLILLILIFRKKYFIKYIRISFDPSADKELSDSLNKKIAFEKQVIEEQRQLKLQMKLHDEEIKKLEKTNNDTVFESFEEEE